ncbi:MAG: hypothetical protein PHN69_03145 [Candidatus Pacebacteria bacterium]|nr:hypothetical protein [Candidatus Paceibacterota bacterium]
MKDKELMGILSDTKEEDIIYNAMEFDMDFGNIVVKVGISLN